MRAILPFLCLTTILLACTEREAPVTPRQYNLAAGDDKDPVMPMGDPSFNSAVLMDQANYKPAPANLSDSDRERLEDLAGVKAAAKAAEASAPDVSAEGGDKKDAASRLLGGLKKLLGGQKDAKADDSDSAEDDSKDGDEKDESKDEEKAPSEAEAADPSSLLRTESRPEVTEIPRNPGDRPSQGVSRARELALEDARKHVVELATSLPVNETMTLGRALGTTSGVADTSVKGMKTVAMKWIDADTLEIEVEVAASDIGRSFQAKFPDAKLESFIMRGEGRYLAAKGRGVIPVNLRNANRSLPGQNAREAAGDEGG